MGYRSLKVIQTGTIQKLGYSFLFAFHIVFIHHNMIERTEGTYSITMAVSLPVYETFSVKE